MKSKIILFITIIIWFIRINSLLCQDLTIELKPICFKDNNVDSCLTIKIVNKSIDTLFLSLDPFNSDVVSSREYYLFQTFSFKFQPNRIIFIKKTITNCLEALSSTNISYMRFPRILVLAPTNSTVLKIKLGDSLISYLKGFEWSIYPVICYAIKKEIFAELSKKPNYLQIEFISSLIEKDTVLLSLMLQSQVIEKIITKDSVIREKVTGSTQISEPGLYYYKNSSHSLDSFYFRSKYDSIIYLFNNTLYHYH